MLIVYWEYCLKKSEWPSWWKALFLILTRAVFFHWRRYKEGIISFACLRQGSICHTSKRFQTFYPAALSFHFPSELLSIMKNANSKIGKRPFSAITCSTIPEPKVENHATLPPARGLRKGEQKMTVPGYRSAVMLCTVIGSYLYYMHNLNDSERFRMPVTVFCTLWPKVQICFK